MLWTAGRKYGDVSVPSCSSDDTNLKERRRFFFKALKRPINPRKVRENEMMRSTAPFFESIALLIFQAGLTVRNESTESAKGGTTVDIWSSVFGSRCIKESSKTTCSLNDRLEAWECTCHQTDPSRFWRSQTTTNLWVLFHEMQNGIAAVRFLSDFWHGMFTRTDKDVNFCLHKSSVKVLRENGRCRLNTAADFETHAGNVAKTKLKGQWIAR